jgi:hypothetical protein
VSLGPGLRAAALAGALILCGCSSDDEELPYPPVDCAYTKPPNGYLNIDVTINAQNPRVPVEIYEGPIEAGKLVQRDTVSVRQFSYQLPVDRSYAVTARYLVGPDTVLAISADKIETEEKEYRDAVYCWEVTDANVDVRLKP